MATSEFPAHVREVLELKREFAGQIEVLLGVEADFIPGSVDVYRKVLNDYSLITSSAPSMISPGSACTMPNIGSG
ncbi:hypothetical protein VQ056_16805 [Paenibacillus sp. JTLBN-2024]